MGQLAVGGLRSKRRWLRFQLPLRWPGRGLVRPLSRFAGCPPSVGLGLSVATDRAPADAPERRPMKSATDRAVEAIEAAEKIFAEEMGATLDLSPAAKAALIETITAAIQAAVAEERQQLTWLL